LTHLPLFDINHISNSIKGIQISYGQDNPSLPFVKERVKSILKELNGNKNPLNNITKLSTNFFAENIFPEEIHNPAIQTMGDLRQKFNKDQFASLLSRLSMGLAEIAPYNMSLFMKATEQWHKFGHSLFNYADDSFPTEIFNHIAEGTIIGATLDKEFNQYGNYNNILTSAELTENGFIINTSSPLGFKESVINIGEAHYVVLMAKVKARGAEFGTYPFILQVRDHDGKLKNGIHITDYDSIFPHTASGRVFFHDFKTSPHSILARFGAVQPTLDGFKVNDLFKSDPLRQFVTHSNEIPQRVTATMAATNIGLASLTIALGWALTSSRYSQPNPENPTNITLSPMISNNNIRNSLTNNYTALYNMQLFNMSNLEVSAEFFASLSQWNVDSNIKLNRKTVANLNMETFDVITRSTHLYTHNTITNIIQSHINLLNIQGVTDNTGLIAHYSNINKLYSSYDNMPETAEELLYRIHSLHYSGKNNALPRPITQANIIQKIFPYIKKAKKTEILSKLSLPNTVTLEASNLLTKHAPSNEPLNMDDIISTSLKNLNTLSYITHTLNLKIFKTYAKHIKEQHLKHQEPSINNLYGVTPEQIIQLYTSLHTITKNINYTINTLKHKLTPQGYATALMLVEHHTLNILQQHNLLINQTLPTYTHLQKQITERLNQTSSLIAPNIWFLIKDYGYDEDFLKKQDFLSILQYTEDKTNT
jgi:hypothetical protein